MSLRHFIRNSRLPWILLLIPLIVVGPACKHASPTDPMADVPEGPQYDWVDIIAIDAINNQPIAGASVLLFRNGDETDTDNVIRNVGRTDAQGRFRLYLSRAPEGHLPAWPWNPEAYGMSSGWKFHQDDDFGIILKHPDYLPHLALVINLLADPKKPAVWSNMLYNVDDRHMKREFDWYFNGKLHDNPRVFDIHTQGWTRMLPRRLWNNDDTFRWLMGSGGGGPSVGTNAPKSGFLTHSDVWLPFNPRTGLRIWLQAPTMAQKQAMRQAVLDMFRATNWGAGFYKKVSVQVRTEPMHDSHDVDDRDPTLVPPGFDGIEINYHPHAITYHPGWAQKDPLEGFEEGVFCSRLKWTVLPVFAPDVRIEYGKAFDPNLAAGEVASLLGLGAFDYFPLGTYNRYTPAKADRMRAVARWMLWSDFGNGSLGEAPAPSFEPYRTANGPSFCMSS